MNILEEYKKLCEKNEVPFENIKSVKSYDDTTLFCSAGMQKFKAEFLQESGKTLATNQHCLRVKDIGSTGDGTHFIDFNMLGLFSFRHWSIERAIAFWLEFMKQLNVKVDEAHIHPSKKEWSNYYPKEIKVVEDASCEWTDGTIGGFCTEFYINGVEVGNIVNPLGSCIDAGFGLERLDSLVNGASQKSRDELLVQACRSIVEANYKPSNKKQGYVLRRLLRELVPSSVSGVPYLEAERERQVRVLAKYDQLRKKFPDKTKKWWFEVHGVNIENL